MVALSALLLFTASNALQAREQGNKKPSLSLKATPSVSFAPARIVLVGEVKGGANDNEEFYCPAIEWEWGDDTRSTNTADCDPYEAGKSEVKRRFSIEHRFQNAGSFRIVLRLKKSSKVIVTANVNLQVRPGLTGQEGRR